jgi:general nucleoside transport system permease protein
VTTTTTEPTDPIPTAPTATEPPAPPVTETDAVANPHAERAKRLAIGLGRVALAVLGTLVVFGFVVWLKGANPFDTYQALFDSIFKDPNAPTEIALRATPLVLAGLAVAVPARAGLVNVGGEGQLLIGGVVGAGMALIIGPSFPGTLGLVLILIAGAIGGALWAALSVGLRLFSGISESVTTLLLNYVALDLMLFLIYDPWKDPNGSGQPASRPIPESQSLGVFGDSRLHYGVLIALAAVFVIGFVLKRTAWGFKLRVVGGNAEAARRAGLRVGPLLVSAMFVGGALAGLAGAIQLVGVEYKLRPLFLFGFGYVGFLASWLGRHQPWKVAAAAVLLSALVIGGDSLQIDSGLPAATVNVLMAILLLAVFGFTGRKRTT